MNGTKRRIRQNRFDNWYGYLGSRRVRAFANTPEETAEQAATRWQLGADDAGIDMERRASGTGSGEQLRSWQVLDTERVRERLAEASRQLAARGPITAGRRPEDHCSRCGVHVSLTPDWTLHPWPDGEQLCEKCNDTRHEVDDYCEVEAAEHAKAAAAGDDSELAEELALQQVEQQDRQLEDAAGQLLRALQVLVLTPHIKAYLEQHDPKALQQARAAVQAAGGR